MNRSCQQCQHTNYFQYPNMFQQPMAQPTPVAQAPKEPEKFFDPAEGFVKGNLIRDLYKPYRNFVPRVPVARTEKDRMLLAIQMYSFALVDLQLYLDTHPNDAQTIRLYNTYKNQLEPIRKQYEERFGPLTMTGEGLDKVPWAWQATEWPWEGGSV